MSNDFPYGITTFCEDFRIENNGKFIIIGGYTDRLNISGKAPAILPSLVFLFNFNIPLHYKFEDIRLEVVFEGDDVDEEYFTIQLDQDMKDQRTNIESDLSDENQRMISEGRQMMSVFYPVIIDSIKIPSNGHFSTRVHLDDKMFRVGSLNTKFSDQD